MANAARLTGQVPSTTSPSWFTRSRSFTRICLKFMPSGFTQKWSSSSRVAGGDVSRHAFVEPEVAEQAESGGEALLAMPALVVDGVERREQRRKTVRRHQQILSGRRSGSRPVSITCWPSSLVSIRVLPKSWSSTSTRLT